ncbi:Metallo-dependent phosphatase-like protein [Jimgerdemannia flammicorona]|uniref:Metallo-dependent phosphatase-like protein n=1 Tax=Jimgerdemannia flammicorona TaxID=994334 RepID=A0A433D763_9FUNG|nr:Metallo-dependent phosphatase-like protein [Jimgerdemannia flammicorona]
MLSKTLLTSVALFALLAQTTVARPHGRVSRGRQTPSWTGKFLHVTDIHIDPSYLNGSNPDKLCHRISDNTTKNTAGVYGALGTDCDSPVTLVEAAFNFMHKKLQDIDFIIYTGDTARHVCIDAKRRRGQDRDDKLPRTVADVLNSHKTVVDYFYKNFDTKRIKFIPTLGNNDEFIHDQIALGPQPLLANLTALWEPFNLNLGETFANGGYFTQDVLPGKLQVINTNSMYFFADNKLVTDCDVDGSAGGIQLKWIQANLQKARDGKYNAYIMGHVPPNDSKGKMTFYPACYNIYVNLLGEYADVIQGHFTGHTNEDMLTLVVRNHTATSNYSLITLTGKTVPQIDFVANPIVAVLNNAPSVIPVNNPALRVYQYNTKPKLFGKIFDWTQYYADLAAANSNGKVVWQTEYTASKQYGTKGLSTQDYTSLVQKFMAPNSVTWADYVKYLTVGAGPKNKKNG